MYEESISRRLKTTIQSFQSYTQAKSYHHDPLQLRKSLKINFLTKYRSLRQVQKTSTLQNTKAKQIKQPFPTTKLYKYSKPIENQNFMKTSDLIQIIKIKLQDNSKKNSFLEIQVKQPSCTNSLMIPKRIVKNNEKQRKRRRNLNESKSVYSSMNLKTEPSLEGKETLKRRPMTAASCHKNSFENALIKKSIAESLKVLTCKNIVKPSRYREVDYEREISGWEIRNDDFY